MPTNRTKRTRNFKAPAIDPTEIYFLQHGTSEGGPDHEHMKFEFFMRQKNGWGEVWEKVKDEIIADWIKKQPCARPWAWWEYDAPRHDTGTRAFFEPLPVPRQRIGGSGLTTMEKYPAVVPEFDKGIPSSWAEIDPDDPPTYESEAIFLDRHGLLTAAEKTYFTKHPELLEPEKVIFEA